MANNYYAVIPAHNEAKHIGKVIAASRPHVDKIVVVDDGSSDSTSKIAFDMGAIVLHHIINIGKGAALRTGCDYAVKSKASVIIVLDADGQHKPEDIPRLCKALKGNDIVFGSRRINRVMPLVFRLGNLLLNAETRILFNVKLKDTQSGFRAFTKTAYKKIRWDANDYSMESEMIANVGRHHLLYKEISIDTIYHDKYKGTTVLDGIKIIFSMLYWKIVQVRT